MQETRTGRHLCMLQQAIITWDVQVCDVTSTCTCIWNFFDSGVSLGAWGMRDMSWSIMFLSIFAAEVKEVATGDMHSGGPLCLLLITWTCPKNSDHSVCQCFVCLSACLSVLSSGRVIPARNTWVSSLSLKPKREYYYTVSVSSDLNVHAVTLAIKQLLNVLCGYRCSYPSPGECERHWQSRKDKLTPCCVQWPCWGTWYVYCTQLTLHLCSETSCMKLQSFLLRALFITNWKLHDVTVLKWQCAMYILSLNILIINLHQLD